MPNAAFRLWEVGKDRYAVTFYQETVPVLGLVIRDIPGRSWKIEHAGRIMPTVYSTAEEAALALVQIMRPEMP